ncbi:hypothetical protein [Sphingomonas sp. GV3]|uniref:hypothetical protein n=1 Tax=Sphingomonas sp. GV3 TaxID=3040671 RepID=UPI00280AA33F|nr:hypothetical protein [Sphingomonas sp. GV3]
MIVLAALLAASGVNCASFYIEDVKPVELCAAEWAYDAAKLGWTMSDPTVQGADVPMGDAIGGDYKGDREFVSSYRAYRDCIARTIEMDRSRRPYRVGDLAVTFSKCGRDRAKAERSLAAAPMWSRNPSFEQPMASRDWVDAERLLMARRRLSIAGGAKI